MLFSRTSLVICLFLLCTACSPKFDWREVRGEHYTITFPAKPATLTRTVKLGEVSVPMTMKAVEIDGATFAVGSAPFASDKEASQAREMMERALLANIRGKILKEKQDSRSGVVTTELEAQGSSVDGKQQLLLIGRFVSRERYAYQVIIVGPKSAIPREVADTFLTSFLPA